MMTAKGLVVTEEQEDISGALPSSADASANGANDVKETPQSPKSKSPIAELLYMRWLEGLRLKWPSIMSST